VKVHSPQDIADMFGISRATVLRKCREGKWPHRRPTPQTIVFTDEDIAVILDDSRSGR
jgi:hypothetical protein